MAIDTNTLIASFCSFISVLLATIVLVDFITYTSNNYKEQFVAGTASELDDVLIQMPPNKVFDISLALSTICSLIAALYFGFGGEEVSIPKVIIAVVITMLIIFPMPRLFLKYKRKQRIAKFNTQLEDVLISISSALKAGFSINQALESIAKEDKNPSSIEFRLLMQELRLGTPLEDALDNMVKRLGSDDFELVATAIITARQTGGELTVTLERLASMIRERMRIVGRLRSLTAQGKLQAYLVGAMPFFLMFIMTYVAPNMMAAFFDNITGIIIIVVSSLWVIMGFFIIKKITNIDI